MYIRFYCTTYVLLCEIIQSYQVKKNALFDDLFFELGNFVLYHKTIHGLY